MYIKSPLQKEKELSQPLGKYFTLAEFVRSRTASQKKIDNTPNQKVISNLKYLVENILQPAREELKQPIAITSGYRCRKLNTAVGGAIYSKHLYGMAADIHLPSKEYGNKLFAILSKNKHVDTLLYEHNRAGITWLHVSWSEEPRHLCIKDYKV